MITDKSVFCVCLLGIIPCFFSCNQQEENTEEIFFAPKVVEAHGYVVPKDSIAQPKVILVGKPKVVTIPTNVHPVSSPKVVVAGIPKVRTPGQDSFSLILPKRKGCLIMVFGLSLKTEEVIFGLAQMAARVAMMDILSPIIQ